MKYILTLSLLLFITKSQAQKLELPFKFGHVPLSELNLKYYAKDSTANAVVLYEKALAKMIVANNYILLQTDYYYKIKIFNQNGFDNATKSIYLYNTNKRREKLENLVVLTHNLANGVDNKTSLGKDNIFKSRENEHWREIKFTAPNVKKGSVIEIKYTTRSPFFFNFVGWSFQGDIPKIYSELHSLIPGNWVYNKKLVGFKHLDVKKQSIKKRCFFFIGLEDEADCVDLTYGMKDVPAFKTEKYLSSKKNYLSRIAFELSEYHHFDGRVDKYTKTWKDVDKKLKYNAELGGQLKKIDFTKKQLPIKLFEESDTLKKAIGIYHYIQNNFKWNEKYPQITDTNIKNTFKNKVGSAIDINLILCDALNAAGIESKLMLAATRNKGFPTYVHPVLSDFNYAIVFTKIGKVYYELDAGQKLLGFGTLPFKILNSYGRILDFDKGSFWQDIIPTRRNKTTSINLKLNKDSFSGFMRITTNLYSAKNKRDEILNDGVDKYKKLFADSFESEDLNISAYRNLNLNNYEKPLIEDFKIEFDNQSNDDDLFIINPFYDKIESNPFQLKKRTYPVDFGYPRTDNYRITYIIPKNYQISSVPKDVNLILKNNAGSFISKSIIKGQSIIINYKININHVSFSPADYNQIKSLFSQIIDYQNEVIILKKKS